MNRFVDWFLEVAADVVVGLAIYGLLRLIEGRHGMQWADVFRFLRDSTTTRHAPSSQPRWPS